MKRIKRYMAAAFALAMAVSMMASCGDKGNDSGSANSGGKDLNEEQKKQVEALADKLPDVTLDNKEIVWMAHYDINPAAGKVTSPGLELFQTKYEGKITYKSTTWENRFTDLATAVQSNQSPDFFPAGDMDTFPKGAIKNMFQPVDEYIDFDSDLWKDSKNASDSFVFNDKHYVAVIETVPNYICTYNTTTIAENGFTDPAELFENGEWDWDVFTDMCLEFTDTEQEKYALDGYWYNKALSETSGVPMIALKDGKIVSNMSDPTIEKVQDKMYNLQKSGVVFPRAENNWNTRGNGESGDGLGSYQTLFIPIGIWALEEPTEKTKLFGDIEAGEIMFVPMPKMEDSDTYYISARIDGYNLCTGAPNPEGFAAYMNCLQVARTDARDITLDTLRNDYKWTEEMIDMREKMYEMAAENPVFDIQEGVSPDLSILMETVSQATMISGGNETTWTACRNENEKAVEWELKNINNSIK